MIIAIIVLSAALALAIGGILLLRNALKYCIIEDNIFPCVLLYRAKYGCKEFKQVWDFSRYKENNLIMLEEEVIKDKMDAIDDLMEQGVILGHKVVVKQGDYYRWI